MLFGGNGISNEPGYGDNIELLKITREINDVKCIISDIDYSISVSGIIFGVVNGIKKLKREQ